MMALGAKGVISVASNIVPEVMAEMTHLCLDNDFAAASQLQIRYMDLIDALFFELKRLGGKNPPGPGGLPLGGGGPDCRGAGRAGGSIRLMG